MPQFINIHTHKPETGSIYIRNAPLDSILADNEYYSYGIHPWDIDKVDVNFQLEVLKKHCLEKRLAAIGEIGLDRAIQQDLEIQKEVFICQLNIAKEYQLPVIVHCVRAWGDILSVRMDGKYKDAWIFHGFNGNLQIARQIIRSKSYLSFGKAILFNLKLQEVLRLLPVENIFFETDDSEEKISIIYQKATEIMHICMDELTNKIYSNFTKVFGER